jgi:hypothetical protein
MLRSPKSALPVATLFAVGLLMLSAPRTVRAVAAALVQVTNTSANPVVTQGIGQQASQQIQLYCVQAGYDPSTQYGSGNCALLSPEKGIEGNTAYVVPKDQSLVITAVDISPANGCPAGNYEAAIDATVPSTSYPIPQRWTFGVGSAPQPQGLSATVHFTYPSGLSFAPQSTLLSIATLCPYTIRMFGYLTAN